MIEIEDLELRKHFLKRAREWYGAGDLQDDRLYEILRDSYVARGWIIEYHIEKMRKDIKKIPVIGFIYKIIEAVSEWLNRKK